MNAGESYRRRRRKSDKNHTGCIDDDAAERFQIILSAVGEVPLVQHSAIGLSLEHGREERRRERERRIINIHALRIRHADPAVLFPFFLPPLPS